MKITSTALVLLLAIVLAAVAADPNDLYTQSGTDPSPAELIANGSIVLGEGSSNRTVRGSDIVVNHALLDQQTGVLRPFSSISRVHIPTSAGRTDYADITRWYQRDGNVQIFRLFQGEHNYRFGNGGDFSATWYANAPPSRVEAVSPSLAVDPGTYRVWEATYTVIKPLGCNVFQLFHDDGDLWSFHLRMGGTGGFSFSRRNPIRGLPGEIQVAPSMVGGSISFRIRANGYKYEVYKKIPFVDADWVLVTIGYYQPSPNDQVIFRWGMYLGSEAGATARDGLLFVSGAKTSVSTDPSVPLPADYYWDNNGASPGFGAAGGTWSATTTGDATQGWSTDGTGATQPVDFNSNNYDLVNFGNDATGLGAGTITVSGAVNSGFMNFAAGTGAITLNGGSITMPSQTIITLAGNALRTINSVIGGAAQGFEVAGSGTLVLNGLNTFGGSVVIGDNTEGITVRINYGDAATASSLGAPDSAGRGVIQLGHGSHPGILEFTGASAAASTNRLVKIGSEGNGSGGAAVRNNDADAAHTLTFSGAAFNVAARNVTSGFNRNLTLSGSNTGDNTIAGAIIDNSADVGLKKNGTGTWMLAGANSYSDPTEIDAGTLKLGADNVLPSGAGKSRVDVNGGANASSRGNLDLNGFNLAINGLSGSTGAATGRIVNNATGTHKTLTVGNNNATATFPGIIADNTTGTGTIGLTKVGSGTQTLSGPNTYTAATTVSAGTLALGANNVLPDTTAVSIGDGTLNAATFDATAGTLDAAGAATINLGTGANLAFANSSALDWTGGTLNLTGTFVSGSSLRFGTTSDGLTPAQLALISAPGFHTFALNANGYLTSTAVIPYATWATTHAPTGTAADDFDGDGVANGIEFVRRHQRHQRRRPAPPDFQRGWKHDLHLRPRPALHRRRCDPGDRAGRQPRRLPTRYPVPATTQTNNPGLTVVKDSPAAGYDTVTLTLPLNPSVNTFARIKVTP